MKKLGIVILFISVSILSYAKSKPTNNQIKGQVIEIVDGIEQPVAMAFIYIDQTTYTAYTNSNGEFSLDLPKGKHEIKVAFKGYDGKTKTIDTKKETQFTFKLNSSDLASK